jgi:hypothetical protein
LEHPLRPHVCGYTDELMALGAVVAGRFGQWQNQYGRTLGRQDVESDIRDLAVASLSECVGFTTSACRNHLSDKALAAEMRVMVETGLKEALEQCDSGWDENPFDVDSIVGHMTRGYQIFRRRFPQPWRHFIPLFDNIVEQCDEWLKYAGPWERARLTVILSRGYALLETEEDFQ